MKTYSAKPHQVSRKWYVIDASEAPLGRLATIVAGLLIGKGKPIFTRHIDTGDYVIVTNAQSLVVTGAKQTDKHYYSHSGHPGGLRETALSEKLQRNPSDVVIHAVRGMLPVNKLRDSRLGRLKVFNGSEHDHTAQKPEIISLKGKSK